MRKLALLLISCILSALFTGCGGQLVLGSDRPLTVGVTAGPHAEIMAVVKQLAEKDGLKIQLVTFSDYTQPDPALNTGDIEANSFQPQPYFADTVQDCKYDIVSVAKTVIFPLGLYSKKVKTFNQLQYGALVALPSDPANSGRALRLLEKSGLIKLKPGAGLNPGIGDIGVNPKKLNFGEYDASQIPRMLDVVDLAAVPSSYTAAAGLVPVRDALALEDATSPYVHIIAVRRQDKDDPAVKKLVKAYHSEAVREFILSHYAGTVLPAW